MAEGNGVRLSVEPLGDESFQPGDTVELSVDIFNFTEVIDGFTLGVVGLDQGDEADGGSSVDYTPEKVPLFPES